LNAWPATLLRARSVCHAMLEGRCDLLVGAHDGQAQMGWAGHRGEHLGIGLLLWMAVLCVCMYICPRSQKHRYSLTSPSHSQLAASSPIITYTHGPDVRLSPVLFSLHLCTPVTLRRLVSSGHITVTVPSLRPTDYPLTSTRGPPSATYHRRHGTATRTRRA
jgi:hypothetical protein